MKMAATTKQQSCFKANNINLGELWAFSPIYFGGRGGLQLNQDTLFGKVPPPLIQVSVYASRMNYELALTALIRKR